MKTGTDKSVILILYEAIETKLTPLLTAGLIKSIEIWNGQDEEENERPRNYPYVAIEINVDWEAAAVTNQYTTIQNIAQNVQRGVANVVIHTMVADLKNETLSFKAFEPIRFLVHRAVNMLNDADYFSALQRKNTPVIPKHGRVYDLMATYDCELYEAAGQLDNTAIELALSLVPELDITNKLLNIYKTPEE
jgi:hypothetical protein